MNGEILIKSNLKSLLYCRYKDKECITSPPRVFPCYCPSNTLLFLPPQKEPLTKHLLNCTVIGLLCPLS